MFSTVREKRNVLHTLKGRKTNWTGHFMLRNCLLKHVVERNIRKGEEEYVSSYWMTIRKGEDVGT